MSASTGTVCALCVVVPQLGRRVDCLCCLASTGAVCVLSVLQCLKWDCVCCVAGCTTWRYPPHSCWGRSSRAQTWTHKPTCWQGGCAGICRAARWPPVRTSCCATASASCSATARTAPLRPPAASSSSPKPSSCRPFTAWASPSHPASGMSSTLADFELSFYVGGTCLVDWGVFMWACCVGQPGPHGRGCSSLFLRQVELSRLCHYFYVITSPARTVMPSKVAVTQNQMVTLPISAGSPDRC